MVTGPPHLVCLLLDCHAATAWYFVPTWIALPEVSHGCRVAYTCAMVYVWLRVECVDMGVGMSVGMC